MQRERRARFEAQGLCIDCGKRPKSKKTKCCDVCAALHRTWSKAIYRRNKLRLARPIATTAPKMRRAG